MTQIDEELWEEPIEGAEWVEKPTAKLVNGDYIETVVGRRRVLAAFPVGATVPYWYVEAYKPGEPTRRIGGIESHLCEVRP